MGEWIKLLRSRLLSNKGETIMETIIAFTLIAILLATVVTIISRASYITGQSVREGRRMQEDVVNPAALLIDFNDETTIELTGVGFIHCTVFPCCPDGQHETKSVAVEFDVYFTYEDGIPAFTPK